MTISVGLVTIVMWIVISGFGSIMSLFNLSVARQDFIFQTSRPTIRRQRKLIAKVNIANEIMRCIVLTLLFIAGILVAWVQFTPDPPPASLYVRSVILLTITVLVTNTLLHHWLRRRLKEQRINEKI